MVTMTRSAAAPAAERPGRIEVDAGAGRGADDAVASARCRGCGETLRETVVDLGMSPLCESYVTAEGLDDMEPFYPLRVMVCRRCWLVQLREYVSPQRIFSEYAYFSSYASSWVEHARCYAEEMTARFGLGRGSRVVEVASNDGYLLQHFLERDVEVLGIEPAANVADAARKKGIDTQVRFFDADLARDLVSTGRRADLLVGNNVLAQVPDLGGFVEGLRVLLAPEGVLTLEFPHLMRLFAERQFDTIYHEHFSYFSFTAAERILFDHGLTVFDVQELPTHGGSLRLFACRNDSRRATAPSSTVARLRQREDCAGVTGLPYYADFAQEVRRTKRDLLRLLIELKTKGAAIAGYGAPGKGNTLLNFCGIGRDFLDYTVDKNPYKQGKFLPGTHIPVHHPEHLRRTHPDYILILPWNVKEEIVAQLEDTSAWGARFVVPIPEPRVLPPPGERRAAPGEPEAARKEKRP